MLLNIQLIIWHRILQHNFLNDSQWRMLAETCKDIYKIFQYMLSKDNYPSKRIIHIPYDKIPHTISLMSRLSSHDLTSMICNNEIEYYDEPYQAKLDKLPCTALLCNEPGEKVLTFSPARLSEKSKDFLDNEPSSFESEDSKSRMLLNNFPSGKIVNEPYQAKLDKLPCTALLCNEPKEKVLTFSSNEPYILYLYYIKCMLNKLNTDVIHRWTIPLIVDNISKDIVCDSRFIISMCDIIKLIPKNMFIDLKIVSTDGLCPHEFHHAYSITLFKEELCTVSNQLVSLDLEKINRNLSYISIKLDTSYLNNLLPNMTCLKKLNINGNNITNEDIIPFVNSLRKMTQLKSLCLDSTFGNINKIPLLHTLKTITGLTELNLAWNDLTKDYIPLLNDTLMQLTLLESLNLNYNNLSRSIEILTPTIKSMKQLKLLEMKGNGFADERAEMLKRETYLTKLHIIY